MKNIPDATRFYIDGAWRAPRSAGRLPIVNPADRSIVGEVALGSAEDAGDAVAAARAAFGPWSSTSPRERMDCLARVNRLLIERNEELAQAISIEMGAPIGLARRAQATSGTQHFSEVLRLLECYRFEQPMGSTFVRREPIGVCALITPWNWPLNQMATKVAPALAAGCTVVLKPSELAPLSAAVLADIIDRARLPAGVFNLVQGDGPGVGATLSAHADVDMVSFTGSNRGGLEVARQAAPTVKRVALELGGKSASILLPDADPEVAVPTVVRSCMQNSGQSCNAPTRLLVPAALLGRACQLAAQAADALTIGPPAEDLDMGPIANEAQYRRVLGHIQGALQEGAELLAGGARCPHGLERGLYVPPTVLGRVTPHMRIAQEEVFGPVLVILSYDTVDEAVAIANGTPFGLSGGVWGGDHAATLDVARRLRTGMVHVNGAPLDTAAPFGGYRMSGNGREWGVFGLEEYLEVKSIYGARPA
ncbi:MAG: hypothetical protein RL684_1358 [Pseudomonadota bacterium]|jgi:aldehyde dehydrogenase (NAD+)